MRITILLFHFFLLSTPLFAQKEDFVWLFGYGSQTIDSAFGGTIMDFNTSPPNIYYVFNEMNFMDDNASICDEEGVLQFYTNGLYISNHLHHPMENGLGLNPGDYAESMQGAGYRLIQGSVAMKLPNSDNKYLLLHEDSHVPTTSQGWHSANLYFSLIDMSKNNKLGKVILKNQEILNTQLGYGKLTAVRHANGRDWWLMLHEIASREYHRILISPNGVDTLGKSETTYKVPMEGVGQSVYSPDGNIFVRTNTFSFEDGQFIEIYKFDRCNGFLEKMSRIIYDDDAYSTGAAISPNSRFLYVTSYNYLYQFDLLADDIKASKQTIAYDGFMDPDTGFPIQFHSAQLAPDGKIYINAVNGTRYLHVIHQPDLPYPDCMVEQHGIHLPTYNSFSLPNFPNYRLGPLDGSPCDTLGLDNNPVAKYRYDQDSINYQRVRFTDLSYHEPANWHWDFGDGTSSTLANPAHQYLSDGVFEACLTVSNVNGEDTYCRTLQLGTSATVDAQNSPENPLITVFPNPASTATNFRIDSSYPQRDKLPRKAMLTLYNATGQMVRTQRLMPGSKGAGWSVVGLEGLAPGLYFWEVRDANLSGQGSSLLGKGKLVKVE